MVPDTVTAPDTGIRYWYLNGRYRISKGYSIPYLHHVKLRRTVVVEQREKEKR